MSIGALSNWLFNAIVTFTFLSLINLLTATGSIKEQKQKIESFSKESEIEDVDGKNKMKILCLSDLHSETDQNIMQYLENNVEDSWDGFSGLCHSRHDHPHPFLFAT